MQSTYPKQYPLSINGISIPVDDVAKCQPISQDVGELTAYLHDLEILTAETDGCLSAGDICRFISPAALMAQLILKRVIEYEKTIYSVVFAICLSSGLMLAPTPVYADDQNTQSFQVLRKGL